MYLIIGRCQCFVKLLNVSTYATIALLRTHTSSGLLSVGMSGWFEASGPVQWPLDHQFLSICLAIKNTQSPTISRTITVAVYSWWLWFVMQGDDPGIRKRRKSNRFEKCLVRQHFLWFFCSGSWLLPKLVFPSAFSAHQILWLRKYPSIWLLEEKKFQIHFHMQGIIWASLRVGQSRQYPRQTGKISIIKFDFDRWLGLCSQIKSTVKCRSHPTQECVSQKPPLCAKKIQHRSVWVPGRQGAACSLTTMLAILDLLLEGVIFSFVRPLLFFTYSFYVGKYFIGRYVVFFLLCWQLYWDVKFLSSHYSKR